MKSQFGDEIRRIRLELGFTLRKLSEKSGIELTYLSKLENNKTGNPEEATIEKLVKALDVDDEKRAELFRLARQIPSDLKSDITGRERMFKMFRSARGLSDEELDQIQKEIDKLKKPKE